MSRTTEGGQDKVGGSSTTDHGWEKGWAKKYRGPKGLQSGGIFFFYEATKRRRLSSANSIKIFLPLVLKEKKNSGRTPRGGVGEGVGRRAKRRQLATHP